MKTIKVSDEMYGFLMDLSLKMNTQDNRATASPFMYIITVLNERPAADGCGERKFIDEEGEEVDIEEARENYAEVLQEELDKGLWTVNTIAELEHEDIESILLEKDLVREIWYSTEREALHKMHMNVFFTEEAVREHLAQNHYHYREGRDYVIYCWRNPEMEKVHDFLRNLNLPEGKSAKN